MWLWLLWLWLLLLLLRVRVRLLLLFLRLRLWLLLQCNGCIARALPQSHARARSALSDGRAQCVRWHERDAVGRAVHLLRGGARAQRGGAAARRRWRFVAARSHKKTVAHRRRCSLQVRRALCDGGARATRRQRRRLHARVSCASGGGGGGGGGGGAALRLRLRLPRPSAARLRN